MSDPSATTLRTAPTLLDRVVLHFSPQAGVRRIEARARASQIDTAMRALEAAAETRRTSGWRADMRGPNAETGPALHKLRARSRDLTANNEWGAKAVRALTTRLVGPGISPKVPGDRTRDGDVAIGTWRDHAATVAVDPAGALNLYGHQALTVREMLEAGEGLLVRRWLSESQQADLGAELPYQVQAIEPDFIDTYRDRVLDDGSVIVQGVEYGPRGDVRAYYLHKTHPGEQLHGYGMAFTDSVRVPARDVIHMREILRAGQVRGLPRGTPTLLTLRDLDDFLDAELLRQKMAACFTAFIHDAHGTEGWGSDLPGAPGIPADGSKDLQLGDAGRLSPGAIKVLPPGRSVELKAPPTTEGLPDYSKLTLRQIAAGFGTTYAALTGDLSQANYSSGRMGHLDFAAELETTQQLTLVPQLLNRLWDWHTEALQVTGRIRGRVPVEWVVPRRPMVDPDKETRALAAQVQAGMVSLSDVQRGLGSDPDEVLAELGEDKRRAVAQGLELSVFAMPPGTAPARDTVDSTDDREGRDDDEEDETDVMAG